ncbi:MAG TPA: osmotically inducible protein OsmC [Chloroflexi bacterium]|nr:osmotically inducible protein OsmC [Chloroflexota bacterium]
MATYTYETTVTWKGEHWGHLKCGNGPEMEFSAPPELHGHAGVMTPEDAFVAAANMCVMMMFLWAAERFKIDLISYECKAEGEKKIELDRTEIFTRVTLRPKIRARGTEEKRVRRALQSATKYSLVANSIKGDVIVDPEITIV